VPLLLFSFLIFAICQSGVGATGRSPLHFIALRRCAGKETFFDFSTLARFAPLREIFLSCSLLFYLSLTPASAWRKSQLNRWGK